MTCNAGRCAAAAGCSAHVRLALEATPGADAVRSAVLLDELAGVLAAARSGAPRAELRDCAALLAGRFTVAPARAGEALRVDLALERGTGAPLVLGAIAATAARRAGIALGLLAGPRGTFALAHATLAAPLVLDLGAGFAVRDIAGDEPLHRWLCAHETAARLRTGLAVPAPRRAAPRPRSAKAARRRALQPHA